MSSTESLSEQAITALIAREKQSFVGRLLKGVVHNISGAVQMVRLPLDLLELRLDSMDTGQIRQKLTSSQEGLTKLTTEISMLASRSNNDRSSTAEPIDLNQFVRDQLPFWRADAYFKHQIKLDLQTEESIPLLKIGPSDLSLAFNELIANAVESLAASTETELAVHLALADGSALVRVTDSGPGPSQDMAKVMFEPFTTDKHGDHDGLGLFLANRVLAPWNGAIIWQESEPKTFSVRLPIN